MSTNRHHCVSPKCGGSEHSSNIVVVNKEQWHEPYNKLPVTMGGIIHPTRLLAQYALLSQLHKFCIGPVELENILKFTTKKQ